MSDKKIIKVEFRLEEPETSNFDVKDFDAVVFSTLPCKLFEAFQDGRTHIRRYALDSPISNTSAENFVIDISRQCDRKFGFCHYEHSYGVDR